MLFDIREDGRVVVSVREVCEFLYRDGDVYTGAAVLPLEKMKAGARFHREFQAACRKERPGYTPEYRMTLEKRLESPFVLSLAGIADGVCEAERGESARIDEIKTTSKKPSELDFGSILKYDYQLYLYAYMYLRESGDDNVTLRLIYYNCDTGEEKICEKDADAAFVEEKFDEAVTALLPWVRFLYEHREKRNESLAALAFPFDSYRTGQRELCAAVYRSVRDANCLFAEAPTGTGKTVSALFPALKALGEGCGEKLFYLTAKAVTRGVAADAMARMREKGLYARTLILTAKSKSCLGGGNCLPQLCPYSKDHYARVGAALWDVISNEMTITPETIAQYAEKYTVCPHELALDASYFCDVVVGDYNHLFDPQASLQRYFSVGGDYVALIDEAHNLPDRAREMYSASLARSALAKAHRDLKNAPKKVRRPFGTLERELKKLGDSLAEAEEDRRRFPDGVSVKIEDTLEKLCDAYKGMLAQDAFREEKEKTLETFFNCNFFLQLCVLLRDHPGCFAVYAEQAGRETVLFLRCLDPAPLVRAVCGSIRSAVFFSATLRPFEYYTSLLGMDEERDKYIRLPSPFPPENRLTVVYGSLSTYLRDRENSYAPAAEIVWRAVRAKTGNYLVFFPSFPYLREVYAAFCDAHPDVHTLAQDSGMTDRERADFLKRFETYGSETLVGFAVCGGVFAEGIDLAGERLSGVVVIGTGMPSLSFERDLLKDAFDDEEHRRGFLYAYTYPGLNRVFQAAGRLIRTETDVGFVVLADKRYKTPEYYRHFPASWQSRTAYAASPDALERHIRAFWDAQNAKTEPKT